jgi:hypothetical protein
VDPVPVGGRPGQFIRIGARHVQIDFNGFLKPAPPVEKLRLQLRIEVDQVPEALPDRLSLDIDPLLPRCETTVGLVQI